MNTESMYPIPLARIVESPTNPRKHFAGLAELAESIKTYGVLQPILVRPRNDDGYECVFGHRRLRAAREAGLEVIPATVRELTDDQVLEAQLIENIHRADINPLEEGDAYRRLHALGLSADDIALKVGKSKATVYARMKLCDLCDDGQKALLEQKITPSVALLVARLPREEVQRQAIQSLTAIGVEFPMPFQSAAKMLERYLLRLSDAPFSPKDPNLIVDAGPCTTCPKRSGAQPDLFPDVSSADFCTDGVCYAAKRDAVWKARLLAAERDGQRVLTPKEVKEAFYTGGSLNRAWLDWNTKAWVSGLSGEATPKALAKKAGLDLAVVLARDPEGNTRELVERKAVEAVARKLAHQKRAEDPEAIAQDEKSARERLAWERREELEHAVDGLAVPALVAAVEKKPSDAAWGAVFDALVEFYFDECQHLAERRALTGEGTPDEIVRAEFDKASVPKRLGILVEIVSQRRPEAELLEAVGVDVKKLEAKAKEEIKARRQAEKAAAKDKGEKPAKAKASKRALPGTCQKCGCTDSAPCDGGCSWANLAHTLCTRCA